MPSVDEVEEALTNVIDPELGLDFVELGLVYEIEVDGSDVNITFTLTSPGCPIGPQVSDQMKEFVGELDGVENVIAQHDVHPGVDPGPDVRGREVRARLLAARRPARAPAERRLRRVQQLVQRLAYRRATKSMSGIAS